MHPDLDNDIVHEPKKELMQANTREAAVALMTKKDTKTGSFISPEAGIKIPYTSVHGADKWRTQYTRLFPDARVLHIVRDPVYAINSQVTTFGKNWQECFSRYFFCVPEVVEDLKGRACTIVYEKLVNDPERAVKLLYDWMGGNASAEHIHKVCTTQEPWKHNGRMMPGLRYFNCIKNSSTLVLNQSQVERINKEKAKHAFLTTGVEDGLL